MSTNAQVIDSERYWLKSIELNVIRADPDQDILY